MGTTLNGTTPQNTYPSLIKVGDNGAVDATLQRLSDGEGNDLPLEVSSTAVNFTGTVTQNGNPISTPPSGVSGAIQFSDGSAFASDAANLFWDDANNNLGIGTNAPDKKLTIERPDGQVLKLKDNTSNFIDITVSNRPQIQWKGSTSSIYLSGRGNGLFLGSAPSDAIAQLQVKGSGSTSATTALLVQNSAGVASLQVLDDTSVFNNGKGAVASNTAFGNGALINNTTGSFNNAIGFQALINNATGSSNTAIGVSALATNTTGGDNTAIGVNSLATNSSASNNTAIGVQALFANFGASNTAIGRASLRNNTASNNTAVGFESAFSNSSGTGITAIGYQALRLSTGVDNTAVGFQAGLNITTGTQNTALGSGALAGASGARNTAVGFGALGVNTGAFNTAVGRQALGNNTSGGSNTAIGENCQSGNFSGSVILGKDATATAGNQFVVGSTGTNAGAVTTEVIVPDTTWTVRINGANYKIAMLAL